MQGLTHCGSETFRGLGLLFHPPQAFNLRAKLLGSIFYIRVSFKAEALFINLLIENSKT